MYHKPFTRLVSTLACLCLLGALNLSAQCPVSVVTDTLQAATKIIPAAGKMLIAESGFSPNAGRISVLDTASGQIWTFVDGLPAGFSPPNGDPSGPSGLALVGNTLYVSIGLGDAIISGPLPNTQIANPNPSSPIFSSVLAIDLGPQGKAFRGGFTMTSGNQTSLANQLPVKLQNSYGDSVTVRLVTDFLDYIPEPVDGVPNNVRQSNPFGIVAIDNFLYVPDASSNNLRVVDLTTGAYQTLTVFAPVPNTLPFGPPVVEAVPNSIRRFGDSLLVTLFPGGPFPPGAGSVIAVDPATGEQTPLITGLSSAIDVLPVKSKGGMSLLTLEFSTDILSGAPGRLSLYATPTSTPTTIASCLFTPTSIAQDKTSGQVFIVEIFTGRLLKLTLP